MEIPAPIQGPERDLQAAREAGPGPEMPPPERPDETGMAAMDERALMRRVRHDEIFEIEALDRHERTGALDRELLILYGWAI